ncbi:MAG TPA: dTMP kinase [Syntrophomonadaceae bacterium]|nr:dTMP kinase [Syntrophomonadaceae bacterium]
MNSNNGRFISLEGIDACGKSTLIAHLKDYLHDQGWPVLSIREPGSTLISEKIRQLLLDAASVGMRPSTEAILYSAARCQLVEEIIEPALEQGKVILADRFFDSTLAYQGYGRGLDLGMLETLHRVGSRDLQPHLTILLDISPREARGRREPGGEDRLEKEGLDFQELVRKGYLELASQNPNRIKTVNASMAWPQVWSQALTLVEQCLQQDAG